MELSQQLLDLKKENAQLKLLAIQAGQRELVARQQLLATQAELVAAELETLENVNDSQN